MMIAIYQSNPAAFGGNINVLRAGATLRLPETADFDTLATTVANAEVRRQTDEWENRAPQSGQLRLLPPAETEVARAPAPAPAAPAPRPTESRPAAGGAAAPAAAAGVEDSQRPIELRNAGLQDLQQAAAAAAEPEAAPPVEDESAAPGVELESEQLFADEEPAAPPAEEAVPAPAPAPVAATARDRAVTRIAGHRLAAIAVAVDRSRRRRLAADGPVVRSPPPPRGGGCDGSLGSARIGDGRRCRDARRDRAHASAPARADDRRRGAARRAVRPAKPRRSRPHAGLPRRDRSGQWPPPTKRSRAKRSSISIRPTPWPRPISTSRTVFTTRPPSSCRKRSRRRPIGATSSSSCSKSISCGATRTRSSKRPRRCAPTSVKATIPTGTRSSSWAARFAPTSACSRKRRRVEVASTSISKPAIRRSISRSTMRRPTWRLRRARVSI